ncbi:hypothetical protein BJ508DRAFT_411848 [Ascobolus immersus RN42]|uniref:Uncharacterized protein n=1 Tax=Ascobolus immersus RN42 TaxID=1160509 RepID=A0A3N4INZ0_ASCIM|nr:hypothetical protein BJ508DRAFT_411848 [Ascobolus immersus RN42]
MNRTHGSDHKYAPRRPRSGSFKHSVRRPPPFLRIRRSRKATLLVVVTFLTFSYYTITFLLSYPLYDGDGRDSYNPLHASRKLAPGSTRSPLWSYQPRYPPSIGKQDKDDAEYTYDGQIRFPRLYRTISTGPASGRYARNRIVLFVAGNVDSATKLATLACQMAREGRNIVQFAFMMRDDMDIGQWATMNGVGEEGGDCRIGLHDARLEYGDISTLRRSKRGVKAALAHFRSFMHPQVVLFDGDGELEWWLEAVKEGCQDIATPSISLPKGFMELASWFTKLDSGALKAWNDIKVHIVVRVGEHNGNLIRLLRSLAASDTFGLKEEAFQLTVEIPRRMQPSIFTFDFLRGYSWPSRNRIRLKRSLTLSFDSPDTVTAAIRFAEEWYPSDDKSYLLLLDDNVEVSQYFWHWVWYNVLQHRHTFDLDTPDTEMYGISFLPYSEDPLPFDSPPLARDLHSQFLLSTPSANATLLFPKHFLHYRYYLSGLDQSLTSAFERSTHFISRRGESTGVDTSRVPHFLRPLHTLAKARGWGMLYPSLPSLSQSDELPVYIRSHDNLPSTPRLFAENVDQTQPRKVLASSNTAGLSYLPQKGDLLKYEAIPWVDEESGKLVDSSVAADMSPIEESALKFRMGITGCYDDESNKGGWKDRIAAVWDLFCPVKSAEEIRVEQERKRKDADEHKDQSSQEESRVPQAPGAEDEKTLLAKPSKMGRPSEKEVSEGKGPESDKSEPDNVKDEKPLKPYDPWRNKLGRVENGIIKEEDMETPDEVQVAGRLFRVPKPARVNDEQAIVAHKPLKPEQQEKLEQKLDLGGAGLVVETGKPDGVS